jgi:cysteine desulfurase
MPDDPSDTPAYLDYAATAPLRPEARDAMLRVLDDAWGNPSSVHRRGREAKAALEDARAGLAALLGADPAEIVFTRGGTESDNLALLGRHASRPPGERIVVSAVEHSAVLRAADAAGRAGRPVVHLPVDGEGRLDLDAAAAALAEPTALVSLMWANNETGVVQPIPEAATLCAGAAAALHTDAVQALGKLPVRVDEVRVDLLSISAHKVGGPRGVGALFVRRGTALAPLLHGGGQERGMRPGTEDVAGAAAFAAAARAAEAERETEMRRLGSLRDGLEAGLRSAVPGLVVNGAGAERLPTISSLSVPGADPEMLLAALDLAGIAASSGSACSSGSVTPSHVLTAMMLPPELAGPSLRFSLGPGSTAAHIERVIGVLPAIVERLRSF